MIRKLLFYLLLSCVVQVTIAANPTVALNTGKQRNGVSGHPGSFVTAVNNEPKHNLRPTDLGDDDYAEVSFLFNFDPAHYALLSCDIFYHSPLGYSEWSSIDEYNNTLFLPTANPAQICAIFSDNTADAYMNLTPYYVYVVIEDYFATEGDEIEIDPDMATKTVSFSSYLPNGDKCVLPSLTIDDDWNEDWDMSAANTLYMFISPKVIFEEYGEPASFLIGGANSMVGDVSAECMYDIRITDVSDKITLGQIRYIIPWDGNYYEVLDGEAGEYDIMYLETKGTDNLSIANNPSDYKQFIAEGLFCNTPSFNKYHCEVMTSRVAPFAVASNGSSSDFTIIPYSMGKAPDFWICKSNADSPAYQVGAVAGILESDRCNDETWSREQTGVYAPPIMLTDNGFEFVNSANFPYFSEMRPAKSATDQSKLLPGSVYNFYESDQRVVFGASFPVNITYTQEMRTQSGTPVCVFQPTFVGTAGELRTADLNTLGVEVKYNGETQCDSYADLYAWYGKWAESAHTPGKVEATFTNSNYKLSGTDGKNITVITYDENNDDKFAPSLEMLRLLSDDGAITQTFTTSNRGKIQFSAGDFNCTGAYFRESNLADVKLSIAAHGSDEFSELTVVKNDEYSSTVSGFGAFYEADMTPVAQLADDELYDIRIALTDESGNTMVQTISPAFQLGEYSGIANVAADGNISVWAENGTINVRTPECAKVTIFNMQGMSVFSGTANSAVAVDMPAKGVYVVSVVTDSGAYEIRKVIL